LLLFLSVQLTFVIIVVVFANTVDWYKVGARGFDHRSFCADVPHTHTHTKGDLPSGERLCQQPRKPASYTIWLSTTEHRRYSGVNLPGQIRDSPGDCKKTETHVIFKMTPLQPLDSSCATLPVGHSGQRQAGFQNFIRMNLLDFLSFQHPMWLTKLSN
jgi:hypothetical protein